MTWSRKPSSSLAFAFMLVLVPLRGAAVMLLPALGEQRSAGACYGRDWRWRLAWYVLVTRWLAPATAEGAGSSFLWHSPAW